MSDQKLDKILEELSSLKEGQKDLKSTQDRIIKEILSLEEDHKDFVTKDEFNERMDKVMDAIDRLQKGYNKIELEQAALKEKTNRLDDRVTELE